MPRIAMLDEYEYGIYDEDPFVTIEDVCDDVADELIVSDAETTRWAYDADFHNVDSDEPRMIVIEICEDDFS